ARLHAAGRGRAEHRAASRPAVPHVRAGGADLADGTAGHQVLAAGTRHPGAALGRGDATGPAPGPVRPPAAGGAPVSGTAGAPVSGAAIVRATGPRVAALLLGAACVAWAASPAVRSGWGTVALTLAVAGVAAGSLRLFLSEVPRPEDQFLLSRPARAWLL